MGHNQSHVQGKCEICTHFAALEPLRKGGSTGQSAYSLKIDGRVPESIWLCAWCLEEIDEMANRKANR